MTSAEAARSCHGGERALKIARRLLDPDRVLAATPGDPSLGSGLAGTALLHARLSTLDPAFETAAIRHWAAAARLATQQPGGIYTGPGALATSLIIGVPYLPDPGPHQVHVANATQWLSARARELGQHPVPLPGHDYDAITGLAGIGRILLAANASGFSQAEPGLLAALSALSSTIISLLDPAQAITEATGNEDEPSEIATGTAHGISGPLALLAIARSAGWTAGRQDDAIQKAANWLLSWHDELTGTWPTHIPRRPAQARPRHLAKPGRNDAWCYGTPGIGRALHLAGKALHTPGLAHYGQAAITDMSSPVDRPWDTDTPTLCHGHAGILQCALRTSKLSEPPNDTITRAGQAMHAAYDPAHPFFFQHHDAASGNRRRDLPGFLTGASGAALVIADSSCLSAPPVITSWDAILLLS